jgi:hypothetical protein
MEPPVARNLSRTDQDDKPAVGQRRVSRQRAEYEGLARNVERGVAFEHEGQEIRRTLRNSIARRVNSALLKNVS